MLLHGIFPPITTPFYPDGKVYFKKLEHNVERYSKTPVAGIAVLGSTGESVMLSDEERRGVLQAARVVQKNGAGFAARSVGAGFDEKVHRLANCGDGDAPDVRAAEDGGFFARRKL